MGTSRHEPNVSHPPPSARRCGCTSTTARARSHDWRPRSARPAGCSARSTSCASSTGRRCATSRSSPPTRRTSAASSTLSKRLDGVEVEHVSDRTFLLHLGGKLEVVSKTPLKTRDDLSMAYTPGVARVCSAIADDPEKVWSLTIKQNAVAIVTDGTAVLGLGDIGPGGGAAGDGGQGDPVQGVRRHRRLAALPRDDRPGRDRGDGAGDRPRLRRNQPRGHLRAALLRDRGAPAGGRSTSPSSTTTSTAPRSLSSQRC